LTKKAWERAPERDDLLIELASRASTQGSHGEAVNAYTRLIERHPEDPKWAEAVRREREAVARSLVDRH
jgi:hypothetical protein